MSELSPGESYGEYLRRVQAQAQRDRDRFDGTDQHLDAPFYDPSNGQRIHPARPSLYVSIDDEGMPNVDDMYIPNGPTDPSYWKLNNAASDAFLAAAIGYNGSEIRAYVRERAIAREIEAHAKAKQRAAWLAERPYRCRECTRDFSVLVGYGAFKTQSALTRHERKHAKDKE